MDHPPRETLLSRLITSASLRLSGIILLTVFNAIGLGKSALALILGRSFRFRIGGEIDGLHRDRPCGHETAAS